ncbi:N-acetyltransferase [Croceivirga lutea]|uniref:GNAT family N-acetyltransferase n=1 Tax=Croceivirga lutea TaxID=1775167 RepID=UPI001639B7F2|nr:GNAT family N-acetyltransferase [Croceivirga lutea]GGG47111.1 N-acetyltransferase [Croceivirga lutea]
MIKVYKASIESIDKIVPLFDAYRVFYEQDSNLESCRNFITNRLRQNESVIFLAEINKEVVGFCQLYTTFSSVSLEPFYILNDLYVAKAHRNKGVAHSLLQAAKELCIAKNYKGLALETALNNPAQKLYEKLEWKKDLEYLHYFWSNSDN